MSQRSVRGAGDVVEAPRPDVPLNVPGRGHATRSALRAGAAIAAIRPDGSLPAVHHGLREARHTAVPAAVGPVASALLGEETLCRVLLVRDGRVGGPALPSAT